MQTLRSMYRPVTATPFRKNRSYCEIEPCNALKPYVRCFWGTEVPFIPGADNPPDELVIPDTCMDIIFRINYTTNRIEDGFCMIDEHSYRSGAKTCTDLTATFGIRFYAWSAILFSEQNFRDNNIFSAEDFSRRLKADLEPILFDVPTLRGKAALAEQFLLMRLNENRMDHNFLNSVYYVIANRGSSRISAVCSRLCVSEKQLERLFSFNMGISPKTFSSLVRYQLLWQDMILHPGFNALDAVEKYGYTDQAHLINDFKRRHLMPPKDAIRYAMSDFYNTAAQNDDTLTLQ